MPTRFAASLLRLRAPTVRVTRSIAIAALLLTALAAASCSSTPKSDRLPPQTMSSAPPPQPEIETGADPREPVPEPEPESEDRRSAIMIVIEDEDPEQARRQSLVEAAAAERKRRETVGETIAVITNENLGDFSEGKLTEMQGPEPPAPPAGPLVHEDPKGNSNGAGGPTDPEAYWRGRVLEARTNWASAVEEIGHLTDRIAELRQRFYAEEDPYYRDSQIKPSWDRALDRLEEARAAADEYRLEVRDILEDGRRASALPGWLREGIDLEPDVLERDREVGNSPPGEYIPGEPKIAADPDGRRR